MAFTTAWRTRMHGVLALRAQPEVAVLHQERGAVLLGRDRVVVRGLQHAQAGHVHLVAARARACPPSRAP